MTTDSDRRTILIVDDEADFRRLFRYQFEEDLGYKVLEAGDGEEGLALANEYAGALDLVVTDIKMPKMDGEHLIRELRERWPSLPILAITVHADIKNKLHLLGQGAYYYLNKPLDPWPVVERLVANAMRVHRLEMEIQGKRLKEEEMARLVRSYLLDNAQVGSARSGRGLAATSAGNVAVAGRLSLDIELEAIELTAPSGDFAEWFERRGDELIFYLADADGHASVVACILACLSSMILHRCHHGWAPTVAEMIEEVDEALKRLRAAGALDVRHFLTFFMGCIDLRSGELTYANAAHTDALLFSAASDGRERSTCRRLRSNGRGVGMPLGPKATVQRELLKPGDVLFLYSDGASEHLAGGDDELERVVGSLLAEPAKVIVQEVAKYLKAYFGRGFKDDTTVLAIKVLPALVVESARTAL
jgi:two-component system KDP operon response regulator KdpE